MSKDIEPIEIFSGQITQAQILMSILTDSDIETFLKDEHIGTIAPWQASPGGINSVKVIVSSMDFEKAKVIVSEFEKTL